MTMLANKLNYDREVIRVWFCNKRQALKNTIKKFKTGAGGLDDTSEAMSPSDDSPNQSQLNTSSQQIQQLQQQQVIIFNYFKIIIVYLKLTFFNFSRFNSNSFNSRLSNKTMFNRSIIQ